ncbi:MAG TPA: AmmeMemoRadiSam system protein A [Spirochaetota bacterium]|nr:AmmeMemoRadiSam system protein A [Spirochaetota bacterium]HOD16797.1 AmmeMemoRadiSam system protein A [Spirochaetota bacterium]HPG50557.1 AmmeMemoRadiSam system protein A [Spirochaetota bacterium]HPN11419.1 AmmeMemoRadiSam system protein A [Spirochaetota bacterium]
MIELNRTQQEAMLLLARNTIAESLKIPGVRENPDLSDDIYKNKCGAFVTLHLRGRLRGCIGYIQGVKPIPETIIDMARASAFKDPRFPSLRAEEYNAIDIEISVLSPIEPVTDVKEIVVGRDGLIISRGFNSGLLLPQVPTEQGWDLETFLQQTCFKAGLSPAAWREKGTKIEKFSAQVFGEKERAGQER